MEEETTRIEKEFGYNLQGKLTNPWCICNPNKLSCVKCADAYTQEMKKNESEKGPVKCDLVSMYEGRNLMRLRDLTKMQRKQIAACVNEPNFIKKKSF